MLKKTSLFLWRSISHILVAVLLLLFVVWLALVLLAHSATGSRWLLEKAVQLQKLVKYEVAGGDLINGIQLKNFRFTGKTFYLQANRLQLNITWAALLAKELRVNSLYGQEVSLVLHAPPTNKPTKLKYINLPLRVVLDDGLLTDAKIDKRGFIIPIERLALASSSWYQTQLQLGDVNFVHPQFNVQLQGQLKTQDNYPIQAHGLVQAKFWQNKQLKPVSVKGVGDFANLGLDLVSHDLPVAVSSNVNLLVPTLDYQATLRWGKLKLPWLKEQDFSSRYGQLMVNGTKQQLNLSLNADLKGKLLPQGEYRAFAQTDWHKIQIDTLEARTLLGGLLAINGEVSWHKGLTWDLNSDWFGVDLAKQWPVVQHYLPTLSGNMQTQGAASAIHSQVTLKAQLANKEQWHIQQQSPSWFWHWQQQQQIQASWQSIQRNLPALGHLESQKGHLNYQGTPQNYNLNLTTALLTNKTPEGQWILTAKGQPQQLNFSQLQYQGDSGHIKGDGQLSWHQGLAWRSHLQFDDLITEAWLPSVTAHITGLSEVAGQWSAQHKSLQLAQTQLQGTFKGLPLNINSSQFNVDMSQFSVVHIPRFNTQETQIIWGENQLKLDGGLTQNTWNLIADTQFNDLNQLLPQLQGQINGMIEVRDQHEKPSITMDLWAKDLAVDKKIGVDSATLHGTLQALGEQQSQLQLSAHQVLVANRVIPDIGIALNGTQKQHQLVWQLSADPVTAEGVLQGALDDKLNWQGQSESGMVKVQDFLWVQQQPFALIWQMQQKQVSMAAHCWQAEQAQLCNQEVLLASPTQAHANIALNQLEISRLSALFPTGLAWRGALEGQAALDWVANQPPHFSANVLTNNGELGLIQDEGEALTFPYHQLSLVAKDDTDDHIAFRFEMQAPNMGQGYVDARLNPQQSPYQINGAMVLEKVNLAIFKPFFPAMRHLAGEINLAGGLAGDITRPDFYGEFSLQEGEMLAKNAPIDLTHTNIKASIRGKQASITGQLNSGQGIANLQGEMQWQTEPSLNLNLEGTQLEFAQKPLFKAKVSPQLNIKVQPYLVDIKGKALVEDAILKPQSLSDQAVPLSADVRMIDLTATDRIKIAKAMRQWDINADIDLQLGENVFFSGFGLQSKLTGGLKLQQQKQRGMQAIGEIQLDKEAKYEAYGQKLNIRRGQILFAGSIAQPALEIEAIKEVDSKIVGVRVEGRANAPTLTLFSDTAMNQDEMLGYLLLGRPLYQDGQLSLTNNNNSNDSALLASAALSLGIKGGQGLASGIGTALGVKDVTLDAEGSGDDTRFTVSGYLTPSLYLRYGVGVFTPVNKVTLRYKLNKNLYLEAVSSLENALDLFYNFKF
jgi:autotransporter translocation and assembly factor TamB